MKRWLPIAVAAVLLSFGAGSAAAEPTKQLSWQDIGTTTAMQITFTEGWLEREVTELSRYKRCKRRCKKSCKRRYKRCKRKYGKAYCKNKKRKCKRRCVRRCRRY